MILALIGVVTMGSFATVAAQDATPEAENAPASGEPAVGDTVVYIGNDGKEAGTITVNQVVDNFEDYDSDFGEPDRGYHFVALEVTIENTGSKTIEAQTYDVLLQDTDGFLYGYAFISRTEEQEEDQPELEDIELEGGDSVTGWVFYQVVDGATLSHVFWQPDSGRLVTIAKIS
jgi:hypothetical protein